MNELLFLALLVVGLVALGVFIWLNRAVFFPELVKPGRVGVVRARRLPRSLVVRARSVRSHVSTVVQPHQNAQNAVAERSNGAGNANGVQLPVSVDELRQAAHMLHLRANGASIEHSISTAFLTSKGASAAYVRGRYLLDLIGDTKGTWNDNTANTPTTTNRGTSGGSATARKVAAT